MVGEYLGDECTKRIVYCKEPRFAFFAIVNKFSEHSCLCPGKSWAIFEKFGLPGVRKSVASGFENIFNVSDWLGKFCPKVARGSTGLAFGGSAPEKGPVSCGEGSVLYFVGNDDG